MNLHNAKMMIGLILIAAIGALSALHDAGVGVAWIGTAITVLVGIEHISNGNTTE